MATLPQLLKRRSVRNFFRRQLMRIRGTPALQRCPQRSGTCVKTDIVHPKKPNSAERKIATLQLTTSYVIRASIPGEGHSIQQFASVLVRGGRVRDLPGIRYKIIRGAEDVSGVANRSRGRSKYGTKKWKKKLR